MSDLDREVRGLLRERAGREEVPHELPAAVRRRVRARQSGVVAGVLAMILVIAVPIVAAPGWFQRDEMERQGQSTTPVTSTIYGVTITYPDEWTLLQLNARSEMGGTETSSLLQLSNFDPLDDRIWVCPLPQGGSIPAGGVVLFVQEILTDDNGTATWPVDLAPGAATFGTCGRRVARWTAGERTFEAGVVGDLDGPAYDDLIKAFSSMTFEAPDDDPPLGTRYATPDHAYVVASGHETGQPWNLLAFRYHYTGADNELCIGLDAEGPPQFRCWINPNDNDWMDFAVDATKAGGSLFAFGWAPAETSQLETLEGRPLSLVALPNGLRVGVKAFVGQADEVVAEGTPLVEVRIVDTGGRVAGRQQWIEPESVDGGPVGVKAFDHAFGELWWLFDDGQRIFLKTREGVLQTIDERLLPADEHLRAWTHTFTSESQGGTEYETVVFGLSSGEAPQVTLMLTSGEVVNASTQTLEYEISGPDLIVLGHVFWASVPGAVRGEIVAVSTGCGGLARLPLRPDTPPPSLPSPPPESELPCIGP
jgi:hypothetical protein